MGSNITQHFRKEEEQFVDLCQNWVRNVEERYVPTLTSFLNPRERYILQQVVGNREECKVSFSGGYHQSERKRALLYPAYFQPKESDYDIALCQISYPVKFNELSHGQILGTFIGNGLTREVIGDIVTDGLDWQCLVERQIADYLPIQIEKIGGISVEIFKTDITNLLRPIDEWKEKDYVTSSLRLDTVIATVHRLSRQKAKELIDSGQVKVNWTEEKRPAFDIEEEDMVSVRRFGRFQFMEHNGHTKKEKNKILVRILSRKK